MKHKEQILLREDVKVIDEVTNADTAPAGLHITHLHVYLPSRYDLYCVGGTLSLTQSIMCTVLPD